MRLVRVSREAGGGGCILKLYAWDVAHPGSMAKIEDVCHTRVVLCGILNGLRDAFGGTTHCLGETTTLSDVVRLVKRAVEPHIGYIGSIDTGVNIQEYATDVFGVGDDVRIDVRRDALVVHRGRCVVPFSNGWCGCVRCNPAFCMVQDNRDVRLACPCHGHGTEFVRRCIESGGGVLDLTGEDTPFCAVKDGFSLEFRFGCECEVTAFVMCNRSPASSEELRDLFGQEYRPAPRRPQVVTTIIRARVSPDNDASGIVSCEAMVENLDGSSPGHLNREIIRVRSAPLHDGAFHHMDAVVVCPGFDAPALTKSASNSNPAPTGGGGAPTPKKPKPR